MGAVRSFETLVTIFYATSRSSPAELDLHQQRYENLKLRIKLHLIIYFVKANSPTQQVKTHPISSLPFLYMLPLH